MKYALTKTKPTDLIFGKNEYTIKNNPIINISIEIVISLLVIISGILALKKIRWGIAILFSLLGFFTIGMFFISTVLSIVGLVLLFLSKHEFK